MASQVKAIPDGYHAVTPYLCVKGANEALAFYKRAFGATLVYKLEMPDGRLGHAEIQIGDSRIMLSDEMPEMTDAVTRSPKTLGGSSAGFSIYLEDVDVRFQQAIAAGGIVKRPVTTQFYGDRSGTLQDPFGHYWTLSTHVEDVSTEEMERRAAAFASGTG